MSKTKRLQKKLDEANKGTGNTTEATDSREEIVDVLGKKGGKLYDRINRSKKSSYQGRVPVKGMSDAEAINIDEDFPSPLNNGFEKLPMTQKESKLEKLPKWTQKESKLEKLPKWTQKESKLEKLPKSGRKESKLEKSPLNHCESDMMHQGGWAKMRTINSPGTTGNKEGIAHNKKMRGFKLPHQSPLKKKGEKDACYHKVKSRVKVWPSAYASGQLVQCRKAGAANWGEKSKKK